jgi:hypothetical protein
MRSIHRLMHLEDHKRRLLGLALLGFMALC